METTFDHNDPDDSFQHKPSTYDINSTLPNAHPDLNEPLSNLLRARLGGEFDRWFTNMVVTEDRLGRVLVTVPTPIYQLWIEQNYLVALAEAVKDLTGLQKVIEVRVADEINGTEKEKALALAYRKHAAEPEEREPVKVIGEQIRPPSSLLEAGINPKFTFENYITGPSNSYSAAVAKAVAEKPGRVYNPLFFHGGPGLGKTHMLQAIGREIMFRKRKAVVRYVTSETFTNEFVEAIRRQSLTQFRHKYRKVDVLLIDDVHFFAGKDSTQEEFFHTFNDLFNNTKQLVLASDRAPKEIKGLEDRLVSRFDWGLTTEVQTPDYETRVAILLWKAADANLQIDTWVLEYIARRVRSDMRRLEGALMRVAAQISISGKNVSEDALESLLRDVCDQDMGHTVTIDRIQRMVAERYDIRLSELLGRGRPKLIAEGRQVAMYLTREMTKISLVEVGKVFGNRDHGTVIHAVKVIVGRMEDSEDFRTMIADLRAKIASPVG